MVGGAGLEMEVEDEGEGEEREEEDKGDEGDGGEIEGRRIQERERSNEEHRFLSVAPGVRWGRDFSPRTHARTHAGARGQQTATSNVQKQGWLIRRGLQWAMVWVAAGEEGETVDVAAPKG